MWVIMVVKRRHYPDADADCYKVVARFTTEKKAEQYLRASKLGSYEKECCNCGARGRKPGFRKGSLLRGYCNAWVEREELPDEYPVDPTPPVPPAKRNPRPPKYTEEDDIGDELLERHLDSLDHGWDPDL